jgi:hypothetical protein
MLARSAAFLVTHLLILLALAASAWVAGRVALRRMPLTRGERLALPVVAGLALLGPLLLLLGFLELLSRGPLLLLLAAVHLAGLGAWKEIVGEARAWLGDGWGRRGWWITLGLAVASAPFFVLALYPPTAFDETLYHLPFAEAFVRTGGVPFLPELRYPVFPQLQETLGAAVLALTGQDVAIHLVQLLAAGTTAALLVAWGSRLFTPPAGWIAAALFLGYPMVAYLSITGYVDVGVALFVTAGLYALQRWREEGNGGWLVLAGLFAGSAAGVKYLGLFFIAALGLEILLAAPRREKVRALFLFSLVALVVLAPWYGRILFYTGNPLFPFFSHLFGDSPWGMAMPGPGLRERLADLPMLPWDVLVNREKVGWQPPFSPAFLLGIPFLLTGAVRDPRLRRLVVLAAVYVLVILVLPPDVRYLTPILPFLSLVLAGELTVLGRRWSGAPVTATVTAAFCVLCLLPAWGWAGYRIALHGALPVTAEQRDRYLERQLPALSALRFLDRTRGSSYTVYALHAENLRYFAKGSFLGDWNGPARFDRLQPLVREPVALWRELRGLGADHLLVVPGKGPRLPEGDPRFRRLFRKIYFDEAAEIFALEGAAPSPRSSAIICPR